MNIEQHPFQPYNLSNSTKLIIGTIPPARFTSQDLLEKDVNFYYGSKDNKFWDMFNTIFNLKLLHINNEEEISKRKAFLDSNKIAICDIVKLTKRKNANSASDKDLEVVEFLDIVDMLEKNPNINTLIYTSGPGGVKSFMSQYLRKKFDKEISHKTINKDKREYQLKINDKVYKVFILYSPSRSGLRNMGTDGENKRLSQWKHIFLN